MFRFIQDLGETICGLFEPEPDPPPLQVDLPGPVQRTILSMRPSFEHLREAFLTARKEATFAYRDFPAMSETVRELQHGQLLDIWYANNVWVMAGYWDAVCEDVVEHEEDLTVIEESDAN